MDLNSCSACGGCAQTFEHRMIGQRVICACGMCGPWKPISSLATEAWNNLVMAHTVVEVKTTSDCLASRDRGRARCDLPPYPWCWYNRGTLPADCTLRQGPIVIRAREE